jgi:hypothetical protein
VYLEGADALLRAAHAVHDRYPYRQGNLRVFKDRALGYGELALARLALEQVARVNDALAAVLAGVDAFPWGMLRGGCHAYNRLMATQEHVPPGTLDFIYQATRDGPESQSRDVDAMDQKAVNVFAAASIVIGLASFSRDAGGTAATVCFALALGAYAVCVVATILAMKIRVFFNTSHADYLWPNYYDVKPEDIKHALVEDISKAYAKNKQVIETKSRAAQLAIYAVGLEAFLVGTGLVLVRLTS